MMLQSWPLIRRCAGTGVAGSVKSELGGDAMQRTSPYIDKDEDDYGEIAKVEDTENAGNVNMDDPGKSEKVNDIPASQVCSFVGNPLCFKAENECLQLDLVDTVDGVYPTAFDGNRIKQAVDIEKVESVVPGDEESSDELSEDNASMDVDDEEFIVDEEEVPYKDDDDFEGAAKANIEGSCALCSNIDPVALAFLWPWCRNVNPVAWCVCAAILVGLSSFSLLGFLVLGLEHKV
ncbi:hypothetical protein U1Q18_036879 [Sarracenia purpurea var. burkii]